MESLGQLSTALRSILGHAVAALEHEDLDNVQQSLQEYNSAWCELCCVCEQLTWVGSQRVQELMREASPKLLETYSCRFEAIRSQLGAQDAGHSRPADPDVGQSPQQARHTASSSGNAGASYWPAAALPHPVASEVPAAAAAAAVPASDRADSTFGGKDRLQGRGLGGPPPSPAGASAADDGRCDVTYGSGAGGVASCEDGAVQGGYGSWGRKAPPVEMTEHMIHVLQQCQRPVLKGASLDDLAGLQSVKEEVRLALLLPMRMPHLFTGIRQPARSFLLHGPPGTGKTMLVERIAAEAGATLLVLTPGSILSKWSGESEKQLRAVFEAARAMQPCIVFMDEVDSLGATRGSGDDPVARRLLNELLVQMSCLATSAAASNASAAPRAAAAAAGTAGSSEPGMTAGGGGSSGDSAGVYVFAATNCIQDCDPALLRRFDRRVAVPLPDLAAREAYLQAVLQRPEVVGHQLGAGEVRELAEKTEGYSGSDLAQLCREAAMQPVRELLREIAGVGWVRTAAGEPDGARHGPAGASGDAPAFRQGHESGRRQEPRALSMQDFVTALIAIKPVGE